MLIPLKTLAAIEAGQVTLAFRRWDRPRVLPGTRLRTAVGLVEMLSVEPITVSRITAKDAKQAGFETKAALVEFLARKPGNIYRVELRHAGPDPRIALRGKDELSEQEAAVIRGKLAAMDKSSRQGPWTHRFLRMIADQPAVRAPDLAASVGWETLVFKRHIRKLKELGLTESLEIGYRISPRGSSILDRL